VLPGYEVIVVSELRRYVESDGDRVVRQARHIAHPQRVEGGASAGFH
jgi:hypothetical protein